MKYLTGLFVVLFSVLCFAQATDTPVAPADFLVQVIQFIQQSGGMTWFAKVAGIIMLVVGSMKVTVLNQWIWSKLGSLQVWLAPALGLIGGYLTSLTTGTPVNFASLMAFLAAGVGATYLHEILDLVKAIPGLGAIYVSIINAIENLPGIGSGGQSSQ